MDVFVGRQPILDRQQNVAAYELFYRANAEATDCDVDADTAAATTITNVVLELGLETLAAGKPLHINCTEQNVVDETFLLLPKQRVVLEVRGHASPSPRVLATLLRAKEAGYRIALEDFVYRPHLMELMAVADLVKLDFLSLPERLIEETARHLQGSKIAMVAERVETREDFERAQSLGFQYFQGYFFARPSVVTGKSIPMTQTVLLQLLGELENEDIEFDRLESLIANDVGMSVRILRYVNSVSYGLRVKIESIKAAITLVGLQEIRKWVRTLAVVRLGTGKPSELIIMSLVRARLLERVAKALKQSPQRAFVLGLLSLLDTIVERPMEQLLSSMSLAEPLEATLLGKVTEYKPMLDLCSAIERANWATVEKTTKLLGLPSGEISTWYSSSVDDAEKFYRSALTPV